jgi:PAS domain S-box-containing protein
MLDQKIEILVVDDDEVDRMAVRRALRKAGVNAKLYNAEDARGAIAILEQRTFDCVFLDYRLPDGDGLQLIRDIRQRGIKVPLVALTGQGGEQIAVDLMKAGASDYLAKRMLAPETLSHSLYSAMRVYRAEQDAQQANQRLLDSEERYRLVLEGSNDGIWDWDGKSGTLYNNDRLLEMLGFAPQTVELTYDWLVSIVHESDRDIVCNLAETLFRARNPTTTFAIEFRARHRGGEYHHCIARGKAWHTADGQLSRASGIVSDITERKRAEERSHFLAEASKLLSASLDYHTTLTNLARLAVPHLADWCAVDFAYRNQPCRRLAVAHNNPAKEQYLWELPCTAHGFKPVWQNGTPQAAFNATADDLNAWIRKSKTPDILVELGCCSYLCVPLHIGNRTFGSILFVWSESGRHYTPEDLELAEDLGHRAALAIENARLYEESTAQNQRLAQQNAELERQRQQIETQNQQLKEAARLKSQFLAMMSHELRTPMNAIIGFSQVLLRQRTSPLTEHHRQMLDCILNNGKSLLALIDDILDLSKIEAGRLELKPHKFNVVQMVSATIAELRSLADEKHLALSFQETLDNPEISNDRDRFRQILVNLLSNAIKFTETGSVTVILRQADADTIHLIVQDTGIGIAPDQQERVFEEFRQVDQTSTRKYSGTGLGLAITKSLVQLMRGRISLESQLGAGSSFCVELPRFLPHPTPDVQK